MRLVPVPSEPRQFRSVMPRSKTRLKKWRRKRRPGSVNSQPRQQPRLQQQRLRATTSKAKKVKHRFVVAKHQPHQPERNRLVNPTVANHLPAPRTSAKSNWKKRKKRKRKSKKRKRAHRSLRSPRRVASKVGIDDNVWSDEIFERETCRTSVRCQLLLTVRPPKIVTSTCVFSFCSIARRPARGRQVESPQLESEDIQASESESEEEVSPCAFGRPVEN